MSGDKKDLSFEKTIKMIIDIINFILAHRLKSFNIGIEILI